MKVAAIAVLVVVVLVSVWALRTRPNALVDVVSIWQLPWGKQIFVDFYGLEIVLVLWMAAHAESAGSWLLFTLCVATMPVLGAMSAAAYWVLAVS